MGTGAWCWWCCILWCWWWVMVVVMTAATPTPQHTTPAGSSSQDECEVLNTSRVSKYSLPTNLTIQPTIPDWMLEFVLEDQHDTTTTTTTTRRQACVRIRNSNSKVILMLFENVCEDEFLIDYKYLNVVTLLPHIWTSLSVLVRDYELIISCIGGSSASGEPQALTPIQDMSLPTHSLTVNRTIGVRAAVGCRVNCPYEKHSSGANKHLNIIESSERSVFFYFRPGPKFVMLKYDIVCSTVIGHKVTKHIADITPPKHLPRGLWHMLDIQYIDGQTRVELDYSVLEIKDLPRSCSLTQNVIAIEGESLISYCNPSSGAMEMLEDKLWSCKSPSQTCINPVTVAVIVIVLHTLVTLSIYFVIRTIRMKPRTV